MISEELKALAEEKCMLESHSRKRLTEIDNFIDVYVKGVK